MADCSKTVDFLREVTRLCNSQEDCVLCPFRDEKVADKYCALYAAMDDDDAIAIVQKWSDEHPAWTWEAELRELLPNGPVAEIMEDYCPHQVFGGAAPNRGDRKCEDDSDCYACWRSEYKEAP